MVTAQITATGLGILCLNSAQGELGIINDGEHNLLFEIWELAPDGTPINKVYPPATGLPAGTISFQVDGSRIEGVDIDDHPIDRTSGPDKGNGTSLRWLLDFESQELHGKRMRKADQLPPGYSIRKVIIPNAYFYTADISDGDYLVKKIDGNACRFGKIGHKLGAMIYAVTIKLLINNLVVYTMRGDSYYQILIRNLETPDPRRSDFEKYYHVIESPSRAKFSFLSAPKFKSLPEEFTTTVPPELKNELDWGVHYECWWARCGETDTIDDLI